jgi:hypothetical protein
VESKEERLAGEQTSFAREDGRCRGKFDYPGKHVADFEIA